MARSLAESNEMRCQKFSDIDLELDVIPYGYRFVRETSVTGPA